MSARLLLRGGHVVSMDDGIGDLPQGDVLIEGRRIAQIAPSIDAEGATVIEAWDHIVIPGLIDTHNHLWETLLRGYDLREWTPTYFSEVMPRRHLFRYEHLRTTEYVAGLELVSYGTTTVVDYCHNVGAPGNADAAIDGLRRARVRHVLGFSLRIHPGDDLQHEARIEEARRVVAEHHDPTTLTTVLLAIGELHSTPVEQVRRDVELARELGLRMSVHSLMASHMTGMDRAGLLDGDLLPVHCNRITDQELDRLADVGAGICITPTGDVFGMPATVVRRARRRGIPVVWGCDVPAIVSSDLLAQMRAIYHVNAYIDGEIERAEGRVSALVPQRRAGIPSLSARQVLRGATVDAARVLGMDDRIGSLTPGKAADVVLVHKGRFGRTLGDPAGHLLLQAGSRDVDTVLVDGVVVKRDGRLLDVDEEGLGPLIEAAREDVLSQPIDPSWLFGLGPSGTFFDPFEEDR